MTTEKRPAGQIAPAPPHRLILEERRNLEITGVREVLRFDGQSVVLKTVRGILVLRGEELRLLTLAPEGGRVRVEGRLDALSYAAEHEPGGFFKRLFG